MRLPIILMLLTVLLLPADLQGLAQDVQAGARTLTASVTRLLHRDDGLQVAEATRTLPLGSKVIEVR